MQPRQGVGLLIYASTLLVGREGLVSWSHAVILSPPVKRSAGIPNLHNG